MTTKILYSDMISTTNILKSYTDHSHNKNPSIFYSLVSHPHHQSPQHEVGDKGHDGDVQVRRVDVVLRWLVRQTPAHLLSDASPMTLNPKTDREVEHFQRVNSRGRGWSSSSDGF